MTGQKNTAAANQRTYAELKAAADRAQADLDKATGTLDARRADLAELGYATPKAAKAALAKLVKQEAKELEEYQAAAAAFESEWGEYLDDA